MAKTKEEKNAYSRKYYHDHKDILRPKQKAYQDKHREELNAKDRARYAEDPEKTNKRNKEWYAKQPDKRKAYREANKDRDFTRMLGRVYGLTREAYDALFKKQQGKCAICGTIVPGKRKKNFSVDHDHRTGKVRGLLCEKCNAAIGFLSDDDGLLKKATQYIETYKAI